MIISIVITNTDHSDNNWKARLLRTPDLTRIVTTFRVFDPFQAMWLRKSLNFKCPGSCLTNHGIKLSDAVWKYRAFLANVIVLLLCLYQIEPVVWVTKKMYEIEIYKSADSQIELQVRLNNDTVWLSQKQMALLFDKNLKTINEHIINIYKERELEKFPTIRNFRIVQKEGKRTIEREIEHYNLDVIISVGYRVKSGRGTQFRQWASQRLKDYLVKLKFAA